MIQLVIEAMNGILNHTNNTNMWLPNAYIMQIFQTIRIEIGIVTFVWIFSTNILRLLHYGFIPEMRASF